MDKVVEVTHVARSFGRTEAVRDVFFTVGRGEVFGLLGPNGAGKTTTIRLMLNILKPDAGRVAVLGGPITEATKERIGYMPEERGLYQDAPLERCLLYLARLKGIPTSAARRPLTHYLERFDLAAHRRKKIKELSKGMQQKAQIIATILHRPALVVIDEPFAALDPVNTRLVKDLIRELRVAGTTILMSTHQMHQVEALCDRILLIDDGQNLLYGPLDQIRRGFAGRSVRVRVRGPLPRLKGITAMNTENGTVQLTLAAGATPRDILGQLYESQAAVEHFELALPSLDEIFVRAVAGAQTQPEPLPGAPSPRFGESSNTDTIQTTSGRVGESSFREV